MVMIFFGCGLDFVSGGSTQLQSVRRMEGWQKGWVGRRILQKSKNYLTYLKVRYLTSSHSQTRTAQRNPSAISLQPYLPNDYPKTPIPLHHHGRLRQLPLPTLHLPPQQRLESPLHSRLAIPRHNIHSHNQSVQRPRLLSNHKLPQQRFHRSPKFSPSIPQHPHSGLRPHRQSLQLRKLRIRYLPLYCTCCGRKTEYKHLCGLGYGAL